MGQLSEPLCGQCRQPTVLQSVIAKLGQQPELHLHKCLHCGLIYLLHLREGSWLEYFANACPYVLGGSLAGPVLLPSQICRGRGK